MIPAKPFYLLRHGESEANAAGITAGGQHDTPLTETGIGQAHALASVIEHLEIKPEVVYHSHMKRAKRTAHIVNEQLGLEMNERYELRETDVGEWDGRPWEEIQHFFDAGDTPPGGESQKTFTQRVRGAISDVLHTEERLPLIVAHGGLFFALGNMYDHTMTKIDNCHLHYFTPHIEYAGFPWKSWHFDITNAGLNKKTSEFCWSRQEAS